MYSRKIVTVYLALQCIKNIHLTFEVLVLLYRNVGPIPDPAYELVTYFRSDGVKYKVPSRF